ncbi:MAG TPA: hypothetical protein VGK25_13945 [Ignavibacteria bacterium]|jgi:general stress protein YciG
MAGRKRKTGGKGRSREHMAEIGRKGGKAKNRGRTKKSDEDLWKKDESATEDIEEEDLP